MTYRTFTIVCGLLVLGCGSSKKKAGDGPPPPTPGEICIKKAEQKRQAPLDAPERISVGVIVIRHAGAKNAGKGIGRFREDACLRAKKARGALFKSGDWEATHREYSDDQDKNHGIYVEVNQGVELDANVVAAAFSLAVDEISFVVDGPNGYHIAWRKE